MKQLFGNESMDRATDMDKVDLTEKELERFQLTPSDLLFGRRSLVLEGAGKCRRVGNIQKPCVFESSMLRVTLNENLALPRYVQAWFETQAGIDAIVRIRSVTTVSGITGKDLAQKVRIPLPGIDIQQQFIDFAEQVDKSGFNLSPFPLGARWFLELANGSHLVPFQVKPFDATIRNRRASV